MTDDPRQHLAPSYRNEPTAMTIEQKLDAEHFHAERQWRIAKLARDAYHQAHDTPEQRVWDRNRGEHTTLPAKSRVDNAIIALYAQADTHHRTGGELLSAADALKSMDTPKPEDAPEDEHAAADSTPYRFSTEQQGPDGPPPPSAKSLMERIERIADEPPREPEDGE